MSTGYQPKGPLIDLTRLSLPKSGSGLVPPQQPRPPAPPAESIKMRGLSIKDDTPVSHLTAGDIRKIVQEEVQAEIIHALKRFIKLQDV